MCVGEGKCQSIWNLLLCLKNINWTFEKDKNEFLSFIPDCDKLFMRVVYSWRMCVPPKGWGCHAFRISASISLFLALKK